MILNPLFLPIRKPKALILPNSGATVDGSGYLSLNPTLGSELISNGGFASDTVWTKGTGWTIAGGLAVGTAATGTLVQSVLTPLANYRILFDISTISGGGIIPYLGANFGFPYSSIGSYEASGAAGGLTNGGLTVNTNFTGTCDNISIKAITGNSDLLIRRSNPDSIKISIDSLKLNQAIFFYFFSTTTLQQDCLRIGIGSSSSLQSTLALRKFVGGINSALIAATSITFVSGAEIELRRLSLTSFAMFYNGVQIGTNQTVADSSIINNDYFGIRSLSANWKIRSIKFNDLSIPFNI